MAGGLQEILSDPLLAAAHGASTMRHAQARPDMTAMIWDGGERSWGDFDLRVNRTVRLLLGAGLAAGDAVALMCPNRPEFVEIFFACWRSGLRITAINWRLTGEEAGYILGDCQARVLLVHAECAEAALEAAKVAPLLERTFWIGAPIEGAEPYDEAMSGLSGDPIEDPVVGSYMLYTSGTTGRPKGVRRDKQPARSPLRDAAIASGSFRPGEDMALLTGPAYHAAPLALNILIPMNAGAGLVIMDKWDAEETLALVERHSITHTHMVATMFHRILALDYEIRQKYDLSSMRWLLHGAAPCPVHVKQAMIEWLGPVVYEYYAGTEGGCFFVDSKVWSSKPGTIGQPFGDQHALILDDDGNKLGPNEHGKIYMESPTDAPFEYFGDPEKTKNAYHGEFFTLGDIGYRDQDGYYFLSGRTAELIISGGVNIYPQEIDDALLSHPDVVDACTVGAPNEEWGEEVVSVIQLADGVIPNPEITDALMAHAAGRLAAYKRPRRIEFDDALPREPTGKILRRTVRERYWAGMDRRV